MIGFGVSTDPRSSWGESKKGFQGSKGEAEASLGRAFFKKKKRLAVTLSIDLLLCQLKVRAHN